jgi:urease gamma subunit
MVRTFTWPLSFNKETTNVRDFKTIGVRLNRPEAVAVQTLASTEEITVSELVRRLILIEVLKRSRFEPASKAS